MIAPFFPDIENPHSQSCGPRRVRMTAVSDGNTSPPGLTVGAPASPREYLSSVVLSMLNVAHI